MDKEEARLILKLQEVDLETERINKRIEKIKEELRELRNDLQNLKKEKEELLRRKEELERIRKSLAEEIALAEEQLKKTEERLMRATRDVEYRALLREKSKLEDKILKKSYELEEVEREIDKITRELEEKIPKLEREIETIEEEIRDLELEEKHAHEKLHEIARKREALLGEIPEELRRFYEENKLHFEGFVVVPVEDEACAGCGIKIPNVLLSKMIKEESIEHCPACGRFIYYRI
ncbi:MAG: hypothetical protein GXN96_04920 [Aquificae bacterium]|nr:hypothetical protein [Aquificota bacterium]